MTPILILGAGRMGGALIEGWRKTRAFETRQLVIRDPMPGAEAKASGATLNPPNPELIYAQTVLLGVKPQVWREVAEEVAPLLSPDAVIVSIVAGVPLEQISRAFAGRRTARVMPTTAVAAAQGTAAIFAPDAEAARRAHALFDPVATTVDLAREDLMHAATAVSGSAPAYLYAFVEVLEAAGVEMGLSAAAAAQLARSTMAGAAAWMIESGEEPAELRRQVTSPQGVTLEATNVLMAPDGFPSLLPRAMAAAVRRSKELGGEA